MGKLRIMNRTGDRTLTWDVSEKDAVKEAERIFREHQEAGATAFSVGSDGETGQITKFDPLAEQIVMVPRIAGG